MDRDDPKALKAERGRAVDRFEGLMDAAHRAGSGTLTKAQQADVAELERQIEALDVEIDRAERNEERERRSALAAASRGGTRISIGGEPLTYRDGGEYDFLADAYLGLVRNDPSASYRLSRHQKEMADQYRDVTTGAFTGLVVPQYLTDLVAPLARARRPLADSVRAIPLPDEGMTVNISRITTGTAVAAQATEAAAVQETDADDTLLSVNVRTYAGQQDVSRQAIERGTLVQEVLMADLVSDYHTKLDAAIINSDGTGGTHLGIRSTPAINTVAFTTGSPTAALLYPKLADAISRVAPFEANLIVMHSRRWAWLMSSTDSASRPLVVPDVGTPTNAVGVAVAPGAYGKVVGFLQGLPVVTDNNIPTNVGGGTNEDVILVLDRNETFLFESPNGPFQLRFDETQAGNLLVKLVVFGYSAFTAGRQPASVSVVSGTGLIAPTF